MTKFLSQEKTEEGNDDEENYFFRVTEAIFVGWFTFEYLIRFIVAPHKVICLNHLIRPI